MVLLYQDKRTRLLSRYEYNITDHLGNTRVTFTDKDGDGVIEIFENADSNEVLSESHYYPFGMNMNGAWMSNPGRSTKYNFNGKELNKDFGLDWHDYGARWYDASIARFGTIDRFAEKYSSMTPYHYAANNPVNFIDVNGDSLGIAEEYRNQFNQILSNVFGEQAASNFDYTSTGMLIYNGNEKDFKGKQKKAFKDLQTVMGESTITNIIFGESTEIQLNDGTTASINASQGGGALSVLVGENDVSQNTILVDPNNNEDLKVMSVTPAYYITPIDPKNGPRFKEVSVKTNTTDKTFHEIGHVLYRGATQDNVLKFNNIIRDILKLKRRPDDETHNRTVKEKQYGN